jgi:hypothetical protein
MPLSNCQFPFGGAKLLSLWAISACLLAPVLAQQNADTLSEVRPGFQMPASSADFEVKINEGKFLVRQQGSQEWKSSMEFDEPIVVGSLD